jgi:hypothetical protein
MGIFEKLSTDVEKRVKPAGEAMEALAVIADRVHPKAAGRLRETQKGLKNDTFRVMVVGRFKTGKSTLLNALLGRLTRPVPELPQGGAPLPTNELPCTATLTSITYSDDPRVRVWRMDGTHESWPLDRYLKESSVKAEAEETRKYFANIRQFELLFPAQLCQAGVTLLDSPGTDDDPRRDVITQEALKTCDAAVVVFRTDALAGMQERAFVQEMMRDGVTRFFTVVNLRDGRPADEQLKHFTWDRLVTEMLEGPSYAGQDPLTKDIHFVDARKALAAKVAGDEPAAAESGLALLESRLSDFLLRDRRRIHTQRFITAADVHAQEVVRHIQDKLIPSLRMDQEKFQANYAAIQPKLAEVRARRDRLPKLFERYRRECHRAVQTSFEGMITQLRNDLPTDLAALKLPSLNQSGLAGLWERTKAAWFKKQVCAEAEELALGVVKKRLKAWQTNPPAQPGLRRDLEQVFERLMEEVRAEVQQISRAYDEANFQLTEYTPKALDSEEDKPGFINRMTATAAGLLLQSPDLILSGGTQGWASLGRAFAGHVGTGILLSALGAPFVVPGAIAGGLLLNVLWANASLERQVKDKVVQELVYGNPKRGYDGLRGEPERARPALEKLVNDTFDKLEQAITQEVAAAVEEEEQQFRKQLEASQKSSEQKAKELAAMTELLQSAVGHRQALQAALVACQQMAPAAAK